MRKIITTTGYGSTGSSALTDLLSEFETVDSLGDFEFTFLSTVNGMRDLEYGLFELNSRRNIDIYIKNYIQEIRHKSKDVSDNYEKWFHGHFESTSMDFLDKIIDIEWRGYNLRDIRNETVLIRTLYYLERFYQKKILRLNESSAEFYTRYMKKKRYYACPGSREIFYKHVRNYTRELMSYLSQHQGKQDYLVMDQLVPETDTQHYLNYFDELKVILVDRDPRDLYLLQKHEYHEMFIPYRNVESFVKWYRMVRECKRNEEHHDILKIKFEDLIYRYDETTKKVIDFAGIDVSLWHRRRKVFDPDLSIKNTNKKLIYISKNDKEEIAYIEKHLSSYCYDFSLG
jgi:hypothetical protein